MDKRQLTKLLSAFAMSDGGFYRRYKNTDKIGNPNAYFAMNMRKKNLDYVQWVKSVLEELVHVNEREYVQEMNSPEEMINITSRTHPIFTKLHGRIYRDCGYKGLDAQVIQNIDWEVLAIMYMADGSLYIDKPNPKKGLKSESMNIMLHTKRLSYGDSWFLKKCLKDVLDLEWNINQQRYKGKTYYYLRLRNKDAEKFMEGVAPFMCESFKYKLYQFRTKSPEKTGDDIVCSVQECAEVSRND